MRKTKQKLFVLSLCLALVSLIAICVGCTAIAGASAELYLSPATKTVNIGDTFNVDVLVNTSGQNVVVVTAYLHYDPTKLEVVSINTSNSVFTMEIKKTADPSTGEIEITLGQPTPGVNTTRGNVATINFKALVQASPANVTFVMISPGATGDSGIILDDGKGTDILDSVKNGAYFIGGEEQLNAELSLSPATKTVGVGETFSVDVLVNTNGQNVVAAAAYLNYDPTKLEVVNIDTSNSVFTIEAEKTFDSSTGKIKITLGKPTPGVNTTRGNVATINFKALAQASPACVSFVTDSDRPYITCVCLDDGKGIDILGSVKNGAYFIGGGGQPPVSFTYVPDDYPTIQAAVNAASAGDTIIVRDGTYNENVKVNKRLTIQSENGANCTIVQAANSTDHVFEVTADYVNIRGFMVEGALDRWNAGMYITANYCNISNNNASNNTFGIRLEHSNNNIISNNEICSNVYRGNFAGIYLVYSSNNIISNNICSNNWFGINFWYSSDNRLINNTLLRTGISINGYSLSDFTHEIDESNTVNGKPVYYWKDVEGGKIPDGAGQLILVNCTKVVVENQNLNDVGDKGILIAFSSHIIIKNNTCSNNTAGIHLRYSNNNSISNNICSDNREEGISLYNSNNNSVSNNICSNNIYGIWLWQYSNYNIILNNDIYSKNIGITGIILQESNSNIIYLNNFIKNADNVHSFGSTNTWNSTAPITYTYNGSTYTNYLGNYWDDYTGSDANDNGIGDTPYSINSDKDDYPLMEPWENYSFLSEALISKIEIKIKVEAGETVIHYENKSSWKESDFSKILKNKEEFKSSLIENFNESLSRYGERGEYAVNADVEFDEARKLTVFKCEVNNAIRKSDNSYRATFIWLLRPRGLSFINNNFKESKEGLSWDGEVSGIPTSITIKLPPQESIYAAWQHLIGHCHGHVWWTVDVLKNIRIGYQPSTHHLAHMTAMEKGWWRRDLAKLGIEEITDTEFPSGPPEMTTMMAGYLDIAYVGVAPPIAAIYYGSDAKIVAAVQINGSALVLLPELAANYTSAKDIKGLKIATFPPGSVQNTILRKWLKDNGLDPDKDVDMISMGLRDAISAIVPRVVDGVFLPSPNPTIIEMEGAGKIVVLSGEMWPNHACCCLLVSGELIREHPEIVEQIIRTHINATEYNKAHPDEAAEIFARKTGWDVEKVKESFKGSDMKWVHNPHLEISSTLEYAKVGYEMGFIDRLLTEKDLFDTSFYDKIMGVFDIGSPANPHPSLLSTHNGTIT